MFFFEVPEFLEMIDALAAYCSGDEVSAALAPPVLPKNLSYLAPQRQTSRDDFPRTLPYYTAGFT